MISYNILYLNVNDYIPALKVFCKAMGFEEEEIQNDMISSVKMFYGHNNFIGIGIKKSTEKDYVGFGSLIPYKNTAWIPYVGIEPAIQKQGLGRLIMDQLIKIALKNNWETIELCASDAGISLYNNLGFTNDYKASIYKIVNCSENPSENLNVSNTFPEWIYSLDKEVLGTNRKNIFHIHKYNQLTIISKENEGYGIIYGKRIGPVIANYPELAKDIFKTAIKHGAETVVLVEKDNAKTDFFSFMELELVISTRKMTYGKALLQDVKRIFGLRSLAYG
ncbi:MAG: hypothetical protein HeimC3_08270 [Candidatus Heimdallarchaeota archaeon LC_3]|nr:MAG: hypothetical protein HeimC3_08270 [Candidatus Heimdallarchaeota archaeon LC_3]